MDLGTCGKSGTKVCSGKTNYYATRYLTPISFAFPSSSFLRSLTRGSITARPEEELKALGSAIAKALGSAEFQDEAKKKTLEVDLLAGEELQALAKEVIVQPPEIVGQIRKLMGE